MKSFNHADGPIVVSLSSTVRRIVVYLLTEPQLVTQSLMFCMLISRFKSVYFLFLERNCHIWMLPSIPDVCHMRDSTSVVSVTNIVTAADEDDVS